MIKLLRRYFHRPLDERLVPLLLLLLTGLAYGILFRQQGFYWDDYPLTWTAHTYGLGGLERYFATNRPFWGLLYQASNAVLGEQPWQWQLFGMFWRWVSTVSFWLVLREVWPKPKSAALLGGLALTLYPGFGQQAIGMVYGHFFIVLSAFFLSLYAQLRALRSSRRRLARAVLGLALSLVNLVTMEYFFLLELLRPILIGLVLRRQTPSWKPLVGKIIRAWLPYLVLFLGVGIWRAFFFSYQTNNYAPTGLQTLLADPWSGLLALLKAILSDTFLAGVAAWGLPFTFSNLAGSGLTTVIIFTAVTAAGLVLCALSLLKPSADEGPGAPADTRRVAFELLAVGAIWVLVAGGPFYLTDLPVRLHFPNDRFTIPFMPGSALLLSGALHLAFPRRKVIRAVTAAVLLGLACGALFANSNSYRRDWITQRAFFWQLTWRMPGLSEGTTLLTNDLPFNYYSDNSLTAPLNWIYAPGNTSQDMSLSLLYPAVRTGKEVLPDLVPGNPIDVDYLVASFHGSTDQVVVLYYQPPGCLRVLDGEIEGDNLFLPQQIRAAAVALNLTEWILPNPAQAAVPMAEYYGSEPSHGWCYYYQKADLARQQQDWESVAALGDQAFALGDYPNDPAERLPFIEGYAHTQRWDEAMQQSDLAGNISPAMQPVLCKLWTRIDQQTPASSQKNSAIQNVFTRLACTSNP